MADRRMISKKITDTDAFLDMPLSTQALYFHFIQNADDDGFVGSPNTITRKIGANKNDLDLLIVKKFIIPFESGVIVIKHWKIHNYIQNDRYTPTTYIEEKHRLVENENKSYSLPENSSGYNLDTQISIGKISIDKNSIEIHEKEKSFSASHIEIFNYWNTKDIITHKELTEKIDKAITKALKTYSVEQLKEYIDRYDTVIKDKDYYFDTKWSLDLFLSQKNAISEFTNEGSKWLNYFEKTKQNSNNANKGLFTHDYTDDELNTLFDNLKDFY